MPQCPAGCLTPPTVSTPVKRLLAYTNTHEEQMGIACIPKEKSTSFAATATAAPLHDPPGILEGATGLVGVPQCLFSPLILQQEMVFYLTTSRGLNNVINY